jgi:polar amino acid transport system permease protein
MASMTATGRWGLTKRRRQQVFRGTLYVVFLVLLVVVAVVADWGKVATFFLNLEIAADMWPLVLTRAARNTVVYTALSFVLGLSGGLVLALMKLSPVAPYRWVATVYIEFFRGLPAILTILLFTFGIPIAFGWNFPGGSVGGAVFALGAVAAAYMAETIRAGIEAVPKGQVEAARSLGMSATRAMLSITLPQAFRIIIPPLTNEVVLLIKDTSLFFVAGFTITSKDLLAYGRDIASNQFNPTPFIVVGIGYLIVTLPLTRLVAALERRQKLAQ